MGIGSTEITTRSPQVAQAPAAQSATEWPISTSGHRRYKFFPKDKPGKQDVVQVIWTPRNLQVSLIFRQDKTSGGYSEMTMNFSISKGQMRSMMLVRDQRDSNGKQGISLVEPRSIHPDSGGDDDRIYHHYIGQFIGILKECQKRDKTESYSERPEGHIDHNKTIRYLEKLNRTPHGTAPSQGTVI